MGGDYCMEAVEIAGNNRESVGMEVKSLLDLPDMA